MSRLAPVILLLLPALLRGEDWPTFRHDNRRSGVSGETLRFPLEPRWTHHGGTPRQAWSGPAKWDAYSGNAGLQSMRNFDPCHFVTIADGLVYYGSSHDNALHALDVKTGVERWVSFAEAPVRLPPTYADGRVFGGADDGCLYALDASSGNLLWKDRGAPFDRRIPSNAGLISLWPVRTSALLSRGSLYYAASLTPWESSWLVSLDPATGTRRFAEELHGVTIQGALLATTQVTAAPPPEGPPVPTPPGEGAPPSPPPAPPATVTHALLAPQGRSSPLLFDAATGASLGTIGHAGGVFCLVTEDDQLLAGPNSQKPRDSQLLLTNPEGKKIATFNDTNRAAIAAGVAYLHTGGRLKAFPYGADSTAELWSVETPIPSELIVCANAVLIGLADSVAAYARSDGELLWRAQLPGRVHGLAIANGTLVASTSLGGIHAFGP